MFFLPLVVLILSGKLICSIGYNIHRIKGFFMLVFVTNPAYQSQIVTIDLFSFIRMDICFSSSYIM